MTSKSIARTLAAGAVIAAGLLASACKPPTPPVPPSTIVYEVQIGQEFCNHCYASVITASSTGAVDVVRRTNDRPATGWTTTEEHLLVTPEQFAAFKARLTPLRPTGDVATATTEACGIRGKDQDLVTVTWSDVDRKDRLSHSFNCMSPEALDVAQALLAAPGDLGVKLEIAPPPLLR